MDRDGGGGRTVGGDGFLGEAEGEGVGVGGEEVEYFGEGGVDREGPLGGVLGLVWFG